MQYLALSGMPFTFLILERATEGMVLPTEGRRSWYWASVMYSQVWVST